MNSYKIKKSPCPGCKKDLNGATNSTGSARPNDGDYTVCAYCATILRFDKDFNLIKLTENEILKIPKKVKKHIFKAVDAINRLKPN